MFTFLRRCEGPESGRGQGEREKDRDRRLETEPGKGKAETVGQTDPQKDRQRAGREGPGGGGRGEERKCQRHSEQDTRRWRSKDRLQERSGENQGRAHNMRHGKKQKGSSPAPTTALPVKKPN